MWRKIFYILINLIECFHSHGQHLCKFIGIKESVCIRKEFNSHRTGLGHQHGHRFIVLEHQYGRCHVMWKHSIDWGIYLFSLFSRNENRANSCWAYILSFKSITCDPIGGNLAKWPFCQLVILKTVSASFDFFSFLFFVFPSYINFIFFTGITNGLSSLTSSAHNERTKALDENLRKVL